MMSKRIACVTELPDPVPADATVIQRTCGCWMVVRPGDSVSEFACPHDA